MFVYLFLVCLNHDPSTGYMLQLVDMFLFLKNVYLFRATLNLSCGIRDLLLHCSGSSW